MVVFSNKAYNAIIRESFDKDPVETGGILLGHILNNGAWIVMEVLPPGIKCIFERAYFEYDDAFVNYLAQSVANQYKIPLELLGLWHRHPGSMDVFSTTDDGTNTTFALQNPSGVISGLVNIDPQFRLTMYHMDNPRNVVRQHARPNYERVNIEVGDDIIPEDYFQLKYYDGEGGNLNPSVDRSHTRMSRSVRTEGTDHQSINNDEPLDIRNAIEGNLNRGGNNYYEPQDENFSWINDYKEIWNILKKNKIVNLIVLILVIVSIFSFKVAIDYCKSGAETVISWFNDDGKNKPCISSKDNITLKIGDQKTLSTDNVKEGQQVKWVSSKNDIATVDCNGKVIASKVGSVKIILYVDDKYVGKCNVNVIAKNEESEGATYSLSVNKQSLQVGESFTLKVNGTDTDSKIEWTSTENEVATVNKEGVVEAKKAGEAKIVATINGRQRYECVVTVEPDVTIKIDSWQKSGQGRILLTDKYCVPTTRIGNVDSKLIHFSSENTDVATIDELTGRVTPLTVGKTKIIVTYNGIEQDTLLLTIKK